MKIKSLFAKNNLLYTIVLIIALVVILTNRLINGFDNILWIADFGSLFGIIYIIYAAKHHILMHVFNLISTLFIATTSFIQHIYFNALFCFLIAAPLIVFGIINWKRNEKKDPSKNLRVLTKKGKISIIVVFALAVTTTMLILWKLNTNLFYLDALATSFALVGIILASNMYIEQFFAFTFANILLIVMYVLLTIQNINNIVYLFMNTVFLLMVIIGYFNWKKLLEKQKLIKNEK